MATPISIPTDLESSFSKGRVVSAPMINFGALLFAYGMYYTSFFLALYVLLTRRCNNSPGMLQNTNQAHIVQIVSLFVVTTIGIFAFATTLLRDSMVTFDVLKEGDFEHYEERLRGIGLRLAIQIVSLVSVVVLNVIVDFILIKRCYVIWGSNKCVLYPLVICSAVVNSEWYGVGEALITSFFLSNLLLNMASTLMTAGRIWCISRTARMMMGKSTHKRYKTIVAIIVESGMIYPIVQIANVVYIFTHRSAPVMTLPTLPGVLTAAVSNSHS
ncbi:hypothetical protein L218DRAFT_1029402 [Marasmius fiardii PR-910]|nr:hypothetical protein L218DRAFT_1029402 [Marasmius fiardii PR-910]